MKRHYSIMISLLIILFAASGLVFAQDPQEVVVTITGAKAEAKLEFFKQAEELREARQYKDAIAAYQKVIGVGELCGKEAEAHYCMGICYTWMGKRNEAGAIFTEVLKKYPDNNEVMAYTQYGLAWVEMQSLKFEDAISRLQKTLDTNPYKDEEFCARAMFQIGRIYHSFIKDDLKANQAFQAMAAKYPTTKYMDHPFVSRIKVK